MTRPAGEAPPPHLPPPHKKYERRVVLIDQKNVPMIVGLSYLPEPPLELMITRNKKKVKTCCFQVGMNKRAVVYREPLD